MNETNLSACILSPYKRLQIATAKQNNRICIVTRHVNVYNYNHYHTIQYNTLTIQHNTLTIQHNTLTVHLQSVL